MTGSLSFLQPKPTKLAWLISQTGPNRLGSLKVGRWPRHAMPCWANFRGVRHRLCPEIQFWVPPPRNRSPSATPIFSSLFRSLPCPVRAPRLCSSPAQGCSDGLSPPPPLARPHLRLKETVNKIGPNFYSCSDGLFPPPPFAPSHPHIKRIFR